ncbi:MAG: TIGR02530 family flagellar biosynthesis protein, partial [Bacteriovoracaceae bacterium]
VTRLPNQQKVDVSNRLSKSGQGGDFQRLLENEQTQKPLHGGIDISAHAAKRLEERKINLDGPEYLKIKEAMTKLRAKGANDSLVITDQAAYIVDVKNNKVVTAVDKGGMSENVFTKIDSTVFMN